MQFYSTTKAELCLFIISHLSGRVMHNIDTLIYATNLLHSHLKKSYMRAIRKNGTIFVMDSYMSWIRFILCGIFPYIPMFFVATGFAKIILDPYNKINSALTNELVNLLLFS